MYVGTYQTISVFYKVEDGRKSTSLFSGSGANRESAEHEATRDLEGVERVNKRVGSLIIL